MRIMESYSITAAKGEGPSEVINCGGILPILLVEGILFFLMP